MNNKLDTIIKEFNFEGKLDLVKENNQGNINSTYMLNFGDKKYLIQKINSYVFKEPYLVMRNIEMITGHILRKLDELNDTTHKTLKLVRTKNGFSVYTYINENGEKEYYRAYEYIGNCISYNNIKECSDPNLAAFNAGKCLGFFHKVLDDFPISMLSDTIPNFHNTPKRFNDLLSSIESNATNRAFEHSNEIVKLIAKVKECSIIWDSLGKNIPIRVTHNDPKLNNVLIDEKTNEAIAMIDLDTVMPGTILFDIGDGIRSVCANSSEDEKDPNKIYLSLDLAKSYLDGYLGEMANYLTKDELNYMGLSIKVLTYELALRFLTDYINGDTYFKIKYPTHNEDRFLNQYTLLNDVEEKMNDIDKFIKSTYKKYRTID